MMLSLFVTLIKQRSMPIKATGQAQAEGTATLGDLESNPMSGQAGGSVGSSGTAIAEESSPLSAVVEQAETGSGTMIRRKSTRLSGELSLLLSLVGEMHLEYTKVSYLEAITAMTNTIHAAVEIGRSVIAERREEISLDIIAGMSGMATTVMDALCLELWVAVADLVTGAAVNAENRTDSCLKMQPNAEAKQIAAAMGEIELAIRSSSSAEVERPSFAGADFGGELRENAGANAIESQPFSTNERVSCIAQALLTLRSEILPAYASVVHLLTVEGTAAVIDVSHSMTAEVMVSLGLSADIDHQCYAPIVASILARMTSVAELEYLATWDYPVQQGTDLLIRQVKHTDQFGAKLYLDVGETVNELVSLLNAIATMDMQYRKDGSIRLITISVTQTGTLSTVSASAWIYPVLKNGKELSVRQVYGATQSDIKLEVE